MRHDIIAVMVIAVAAANGVSAQQPRPQGRVLLTIDPTGTRSEK